MIANPAPVESRNAPGADLVARYRTRAPRYTSFPTAPQFGPIAMAEVQRALASGTGPMALYAHIPFCRSLCLYCGCHVEITTRRSVGAEYVDLLLREADLYAAQLRPGRTLAQLALGGGTPTFLLPDLMERLILGLRERFPFAPDGDFSIEVDPRTIDAEYLERLVALGFNRFSLGVQDFDPVVLKAVKRHQTTEMTWSAVQTLRSQGNFDLNFDLMYGLPHQTEETFRATLETVVAMRPTRVALFLYAHVPWMKPAQKVVAKQGLPEADLKARLFAIAAGALRGAGYEAIGMDHFALPGDALLEAQASGTLQRNFMGYTTRAGLDQIGLGVSAIGNFGGVYAQDHKNRATWSDRVTNGELPIERGFVLSAEDLERRRVIMDLFCNFRVRFAPGAFASERARLEALIADGLVVVRDDGVEVTPLGRHFIRNVCSVFDSYFESDVGERRYSETA